MHILTTMLWLTGCAPDTDTDPDVGSDVDAGSDADTMVDVDTSDVDTTSGPPENYRRASSVGLAEAAMA